MATAAPRHLSPRADDEAQKQDGEQHQLLLSPNYRKKSNSYSYDPDLSPTRRHAKEKHASLGWCERSHKVLNWLDEEGGSVGGYLASCVPPLHITEFCWNGERLHIPKNYRAALYAYGGPGGYYTTEAVVGAFLGKNNYFPSYEVWRKQSSITAEDEEEEDAGVPREDAEQVSSEDEETKKRKKLLEERKKNRVRIADPDAPVLPVRGLSPSSKASKSNFLLVSETDSAYSVLFKSKKTMPLTYEQVLEQFERESAFRVGPKNLRKTIFFQARRMVIRKVHALLKQFLYAEHDNAIFGSAELFGADLFENPLWKRWELAKREQWEKQNEGPQVLTTGFGMSSPSKGSTASPSKKGTRNKSTEQAVAVPQIQPQTKMSHSRLKHFIRNKCVGELVDALQSEDSAMYFTSAMENLTVKIIDARKCKDSKAKAEIVAEYVDDRGCFKPLDNYLGPEPAKTEDSAPIVAKKKKGDAESEAQQNDGRLSKPNPPPMKKPVSTWDPILEEHFFVHLAWEDE
ncbi:unnamed protein product [Amoebophrya sp. A25]|nr:unnamed protein product [Amoebophrya sp. A25]|eukprot:GSA25T00016405001.1